MKFNKLALPVLVALVYAPIQAVAAPAAAPALGADIKNLTVFAKTYISAGANSNVLGDMVSGDVLTTGDSANVVGSITSVGASNVGGGTAKVGKNMTSGDVATVGNGGNIAGNITSSGAATIGANAKLGGNMVAGGIASTGNASTVAGFIKSGGYVSVGANSVVTGDVAGVGATVIGGGGSVGSLSTLSSSPINPTSFTAGLFSIASTDAQQVNDAQIGFSAMGFGTGLSTTMTTNMTLTGGGVFSAANFSTTAGTTLTLDDQGNRHDWVFNITDYLVTGASSQVVMSNLHSGSTLTWNVAHGYAALGGAGTFLGTILANTYISVGASTSVAGMNGSCGIFSATSYVSTGAGSTVGAHGCGMSPGPMNPIPEPETYAMMLAGLLATVFVSRRRKAK